MGSKTRKAMMVLSPILVITGLINAIFTPVTGLIIAACGVILFFRAKAGGYAALWENLTKRRS